LSPRVNKRTDQYGGSFDNRSRIVFEIIDAVKAIVNDEKCKFDVRPTKLRFTKTCEVIISIKINSADFSEGGFDENESREMIFRLEAAGVDIIELSGGTFESFGFFHKKESTKKREAFFIEFAERIRPHLTKAKLCVTGGFRSLEGMTRAVQERSTDLIGLARPLTAEPRLCADLIAGRTTAAKASRLDDSLSVSASYRQIVDIGAGRAPADLSNEDVANAIIASLTAMVMKPSHEK
jgi:2,4-dienoyl-CoA reductase-like NADH-dependent reductase (Old Yellow Enzyme family)